MKVDDALIEKLANLARLEFDPEEKESLRKDLERMIGFVDKLNELDTTGIEPQLNMGDALQVLREDEVQGSVSRETALRNAPDNDGIYVRVPKVIRNPAQ